MSSDDGNEYPRVTVVPFKWYHVTAMDLRPQERAYLEQFPDYLERAKVQETRGPCYSAIVPGKGIACSWGFTQMWAGVYEAWMLTSVLVERYPYRVIRSAREEMDKAAIDLKAHRLQMAVNASSTQSLRFAKALQFKTEGVLNSYGPDGSDYVMLARTTKGSPDGGSIRQKA